MKKLLIAFTFLTSLSSYACLDITGKYLCAEEAANDLALGTREIQFKKSPFIDVYSVGVGDSATIYEVDSWNPAMNPNTGEVDLTTGTMAECKEDSVLLHTRVTLNEDDIEVTMEGSYEVTPIPNGVQIRILLEGDEFFNFDCAKI